MTQKPICLGSPGAALLAWVVSFALAAGLGGCGGGGPAAAIRIDGSSTVFPITEAVAEEFRGVQPDTRVTVGFSGTGGGFKKFTAGEIDICDASREISDEERQLCVRNKIEFLELQIAYDGLAVVVNPRNDWVDCLTVELLREMWRPESGVKLWSDLNPEWPKEPLRLYGPGTDSGTFDYFTEAIVGKARESRSDYSPSENDNVLVSGIEADRYALGYFGYAYYAENKDKLKVLGIDGGEGCVLPSPETVRGGQYKPLSRPLFLYVSRSALARPDVAEFVKFYLDHAEQLAAEVGYFAVPEHVMAANRATLDAALGKSP